MDGSVFWQEIGAFYRAALWSSMAVSLAALSVALVLLARCGLLRKYLRRAGHRIRILRPRLQRLGPAAALAAVIILAAGITLRALADETAVTIGIGMEEAPEDENGMPYYREENAGISVRIGLPEGTDPAAEEGAGLLHYRILVEGERGTLSKEAAEEELAGCRQAEWSVPAEDVAALGEGKVSVTVQAASEDGEAEGEKVFFLDLTPPTALVKYSCDRPLYIYEEEGKAYTCGTLTVSLSVEDSGGGETVCEADIAVNEGDEEVPLEDGGQYVLQQDGMIRVSAAGGDLAGNPLAVKEVWECETERYGDGQPQIHAIVRDTVQPVLHSAVKEPEGPDYCRMEEEDIVFYGALPENYAGGRPCLEGWFFVEEENSDPDRVEVSLLHSAEEERTAEEIRPGEGASVRSCRPGEDGSCCIALEPGTPEAPDGVYCFAVKGTDRAGNPLVPAGANSGEYYSAPFPEGMVPLPMSCEDAESGRFVSGRKVLDTASPEAVLTVSTPDDPGEVYCRVDLKRDGQQLQEDTLAPYRREDEAVVRISSEDLSPTAVCYTVVSTREEACISAGEESGFASRKEVEHRLTGEQVFSVQKVVLTDRAGNKTEVFSRTPDLYLDIKPPDIDLDPPEIRVRAVSSITGRAPEGQPLYGGPVRILVQAADPGENGPGSGLSEVFYDLEADGHFLVEGRRLFTGTPAPEEEDGAGTDGFFGSILIPAGEEMQTNRLKVTVYAVDRAGNRAGAQDGGSFQFGIDTTAPSVHIRYDNNAARNGQYFAAPRTAFVEVRERNFAADKLRIDLSGGTQSAWHYEPGNDPQGNEDRWTCEVRFAEDGDYSPKIWGTDALGNTAEAEWEGISPQLFTVDMTPPVLEVQFRDRGSSGGRFFNHPRQALLTVHEHSFSGALLQVSSPAEILETEGDITRVRCLFEEDGEYRLTASCTDLAGNQAVPLVSEPFIIDTVPPLISVGGCSQEILGADAGRWAPVVSAADAWGVEMQAPVLFNLSAAGRQSPVFWEERRNGLTEAVFSLHPLSAVRSSDGYWLMQISARDPAGNVSERTVRCCVNRFGSVFGITGETRRNLEGGYYKGEGEIALTEVNVSPIVRRQILLLRDGETRVLEEGTEYEAETAYTAGMYRAVYRISPLCFAREGTYRLLIRTEDAAGNRNSSAGFRGALLTVDREPPVCRILGTDTAVHSFRTRALPLRVLCTDNREIRGIRIRVQDGSGRILAERRFDGMQNDEQGIPVLLQEAPGEQTLLVEAADGAGNRGESSYTVSVHAGRVSGENTSGNGVLGTAAFGAGAAALAVPVFLLLCGRKKSGEEK